MVGLLQGFANQPVVVDLAVNGQNNAIVGIGEWLCPALCSFVRFGCRPQDSGARPTNADDTKPFMAKVLHFRVSRTGLVRGGGGGGEKGKDGEGERKREDGSVSSNSSSVLVLLEMTLPPEDMG